MVRGLNMKNKLKAGILLGVSIGLMIMVMVIGMFLGQEKSQITTIKKTKASPITYNKIIDLNQDSASLGITPTVIIPTSSILSSPTTSFLADAGALPTESLIPSATIQVVNTVEPTKPVSMPVSGKGDYLLNFAIVASIIVFLSLIF